MTGLRALTVEQLAILLESSIAILNAADLETALQTLLVAVAALTGAESGGVRLVVDPADALGPFHFYLWYGGDRYGWEEEPSRIGENTGQVLRSGVGVYTPDTSPGRAAGNVAARHAFADRGVCASLVVPLRLAGQMIGTLHADARRAHAFCDEQLVPLQLLADYAAGAVRRARLAVAEQAGVRRLEVMERISAAVNAEGNLDALLARVLQAAAELVDFQRGQIALVDPDHRYVRGRVGYNLQQGVLEVTVRRLFATSHPDEDMFAQVVRTGQQAVFGYEHPAVYRPTLERYGMVRQDTVVTPIRQSDHVVGVMGLAFLHRVPSMEDLWALRLIADQAAGVIARARLVDQLQAARERLDETLQVTRAVLYSYDAQGRLDNVQGNLEAILGAKPEEVIGQSILAFALPADQPVAKSRLARRLAGAEETEQLEVVLRRRSGHGVPVLVLRGPRYVDGRPAGGAGLVLDQSALQQARHERDLAKAAQSRAEGAIGTGRAVAHELATPLGVALGLAEILAATMPFTADERRDIEGLQTQLLRAGDLLKRFSRIARYEEMASPAGPQLDVQRASR